MLDPALEQALVVHENTYRQPLRAPAGQPALIAALGAFSEDMAAAVLRLPKPAPPPKPAPLY